MSQIKKIQEKLNVFRISRLKSYYNDRSSGLRVLVVDDEKINQLFMLGHLKKLGITADFANNGAEALAMVSGIHFDVVFMDVEMPVMDGIEATRQIQSIHPNPPLIIGYTTLQGSHNEKICLEAGMSRIIHKKISFHEIESLIVSIYKKLLNA